MRRQNLASILTSGGQTTQSINFQKEMIHKLQRPVSPSKRLRSIVQDDTWGVINPQRQKRSPQKRGKGRAAPFNHFQRYQIQRPAKRLIRSSSHGVWSSLIWNKN